MCLSIAIFRDFAKAQLDFMSDDYDSPWKEALEIYLRDFFEKLSPAQLSILIKESLTAPTTDEFIKHIPAAGQSI
jgi:hypothetical protein